jgi:F-type H+-transporting ATPase subunit delta
MTNRTAANRYARALLDVAIKENGNLEQLEAELASFHQMVTQHPGLEKVLLNPAVPAPRKRAAVEQLVVATRPGAVLGKLLVLLAERDRLVLLPDLLAAYRARLLEHRKVVRAEVTTAEPIGPERLKAIQQKLSQVTGQSVTLETRVDPAIIGGVVARIGSMVYDASVTTQLQKMKQRLTESV